MNISKQPLHQHRNQAQVKMKSQTFGAARGKRGNSEKLHESSSTHLGKVSYTNMPLVHKQHVQHIGQLGKEKKQQTTSSPRKRLKNILSVNKLMFTMAQKPKRKTTAKSRKENVTLMDLGSIGQRTMSKEYASSQQQSTPFAVATKRTNNGASNLFYGMKNCGNITRHSASRVFATRDYSIESQFNRADDTSQTIAVYSGRNTLAHGNQPCLASKKNISARVRRQSSHNSINNKQSNAKEQDHAPASDDTISEVTLLRLKVSELESQMSVATSLLAKLTNSMVQYKGDELSQSNGQKSTCLSKEDSKQNLTLPSKQNN